MILHFQFSAEAVVRGFKLGLLSSADYNNLAQCESLDDIKLYLVSLYSLFCALISTTSRSLKKIPFSSTKLVVGTQLSQ